MIKNICGQNGLLIHLYTALKTSITIISGISAEPVHAAKGSLLALLNERVRDSSSTQIPQHKKAYIMESDNQLIFKAEKSVGKATQEFKACQLARILLPKSLSPPVSWGHLEGTLIIEEQDGMPFCATNRDHMSLAIDFLSKLHSIEISDTAFQLLHTHGFDHYFGETLKNRLYDEVKYAQFAYGSIKRLRFLVDKLVGGVNWLVEHFSLQADPVLGHGDFSTNNLLVLGGRLQPVDWIDFGLCERAYEIVHFMKSLDAEHRSDIIEQYYANVSAAESQHDLLTKGMAIDTVIRAGLVARKICIGYASAMDNELLTRFRHHVEVLSALKSHGGKTKGL